ncbi:putative serine aminopeptidase, S33, alpha/Beta hydrolase [Helianthus annuus]|nr:putative serine aminopeptidase, S33, alpha/Beta hydrolase [Helianthus annuus]
MASPSSTVLRRLCRLPPSIHFTSVVTFRAFSTEINGEKVSNKPPICTADELHYVFVKNSDWKLALWRYLPSPQASWVGTNAIAYDLSPESSFARHMCEHGFDTWILEVRGSGLSMQETNRKQIEQSAHEISNQMEAASATGTRNAQFAPQPSNNNETAPTESETVITTQQPISLPTVFPESVIVTKLTETFITLSARASDFVSESQPRLISAKLFDQFSKLVGESFIAKRFNEIKEKISSFLEVKHDSGVASQIRDSSQKLVNILEEGQRTVSSPLFDLQERLTIIMEGLQKQVDLIGKFDWDFDHHLEEDVPAAMAYIRAHTQPEDGKLVAVGHSMGGVLLYSMLSRYGFEGKDPGLAAIVTLASSLDYASSKSSLKLLLPLVDPAQALNVPIIPLGAMLTAAYPLTSRSIPAKVLLQLASALREHGLSDRRSGTFFYKDHIHKINIPVLAIAGDRDAICPPEAVRETVKLIPEKLVTYKLFGEPDGPHYAHYDLVGGLLAVDEVYPSVVQFLSSHDH